jgi:hypothetical protein
VFAEIWATKQCYHSFPPTYIPSYGGHLSLYLYSHHCSPSTVANLPFSLFLSWRTSVGYEKGTARIYPKAAEVEVGHVEGGLQTSELPFLRQKHWWVKDAKYVLISWFLLLSVPLHPSAKCKLPCWDGIISKFYLFRKTSEVTQYAADVSLASRNMAFPKTTSECVVCLLEFLKAG